MGFSRGCIKKLGYDIKKDVTLSYVDGEETLTNISDDQDVVVFTNQLRTARTVNLYVETSNVRHEYKLPGVLLSGSDSDVIRNVQKENDSDKGSEFSEDDEERLVDVPFINYNQKLMMKEMNLGINL